jgi:hypothetical protein
MDSICNSDTLQIFNIAQITIYFLSFLNRIIPVALTLFSRSVSAVTELFKYIILLVHFIGWQHVAQTTYYYSPLWGHSL